MKVRISSDSTCDLSQELIERYDIRILPLYVICDEKGLKDGIELTPDELFAHKEKTGRLCSTAAVSVADYIDYFRETLKTNDAIVHFTISSEMSACYQNACIAAQEFENVYPVDSRNLSTGIGQLVIEAAQLAAEGKSGAEIQAHVNEMTARVDVSFLVDTLEYLHKGGRCSSVAALGANLLSLKPCIEVKNGAMGVGKKYRGSLQKSLLSYVRDKLEGAEDIDTRRIFITNSGGAQMSDELIESVREEICKYQSFDEIFITRTGCTVSSHCGPGTLGILFIRK